MVSNFEKEIHRISKEIQDLRKQLKIREVSPQQKLRRYHALIDRIARCPEVDLTPDEALSRLRRKEY